MQTPKEWALKFYQSAGFCKIYYSHIIFEVIIFLSKIQNHPQKLSNYGDISKIWRKKYYLEKLNSKIWKKNYCLEFLKSKIWRKNHTQCPRTDLNKRFLPRPKTTTTWKLIPHRPKFSKNWNPPRWVPLHTFFKNWYLLIQKQLHIIS